ncbi:MAG: nucleoside triphosphate hydrolase [Legionella sp.]|nr:MAG: nucleoside triphosphate hydrolase [Legionella sp.]
MDLLEKVVQLEHDASEFGFAWEKTSQIMQQIQNECAEVQEHLITDDYNRMDLQEEIGDLMHAVFSLCVFCQFEPRETLEKTLQKFERRISSVKSLAQAEGLISLKGRSSETLMHFWDKAKRLEE